MDWVWWMVAGVQRACRGTKVYGDGWGCNEMGGMCECDVMMARAFIFYRRWDGFLYSLGRYGMALDSVEFMKLDICSGC